MLSLQKYVRSRLLAVAANATVSQRLGLPSETIRQAFAYVLTDNAPLRRLASSPQAAGPSHELTFGHRCQYAPLCTSCRFWIFWILWIFMLSSALLNRMLHNCFTRSYLLGPVFCATCLSWFRTPLSWFLWFHHSDNIADQAQASSLSERISKPTNCVSETPDYKIRGASKAAFEVLGCREPTVSYSASQGFQTPIISHMTC